jgi:hypothetical protein
MTRSLRSSLRNQLLPAAFLLTAALSMPASASGASPDGVIGATAPVPAQALMPTAPSAAPASASQTWAFVPILISNAETGIQAGALVIRFLNPDDTINNSSTVGVSARISQKMQVEVDVFPEWYLRHNLYHVTADLDYIRWPADFYGIGNASDIPKDSADHYLAQGVIGDLTVERQWWPGIFAGPQALFNYEDIAAKGVPALLTDTVSGRQGGLTSGLGGVMTFDKRDASYWTRSGTFLRAKAAWYRSMWGSDFDYDSYSLEAHQFIPMFTTGALGLSTTLQMKEGDIPFRELSTADGDHMLRGLVRGKYRDRHLLVVQGEYKSYLPDYGWLSHPWVRNRLGYAVFAEAGQVAHRMEDFAWEEFRPDFGVGLRYAMNPAQRMNIRIDVGYVDGGVAPAINIKEAF